MSAFRNPALLALLGHTTGRTDVYTAPKYGTRPIRNVTIGTAQLRSVTEMASPQPFLCLSRIPIRYDFRGGTKVIR